jgi:predicted AlkP superfamily pyrophosphatase or phosphodiesterase
VGNAIEVVDTAIHNLFSYLANNSLLASTNVIIVSDHGMTALSDSRVIYIDDCINMTAVRVCIIIYSFFFPYFFFSPFFFSPFFLQSETNLQKIVDMTPNCFILPNDPAIIPKLLSNLTECRATYPNLTSYLKEDIPAHYFFSDNRRITPILAIADLGWSITTRPSRTRYTGTGSHGYDNRYLFSYFSVVL